MRNKLFSLIIICVVVLISFSSCGSKLNVEDVCYKEASEIRQNFYLSEKDDLVLTFSSGYREKEYNLNSNYSGESVGFGLLTLYSKAHSNLAKDGSSFTIFLNDEKYSGEFEKNPYDGSLVFDIGTCINENYIKVSLVLSGESLEFELINESLNWSVGFYDAYTIACVQNQNLLKKYIQNNKFDGEVYIKVSYNFSIDLNAEWYIKFLMEDKTISTIVDKNNGNIISNVIQ